MKRRQKLVTSIVASLVAFFFLGCNSRTLVITVDEVINTSNPREANLKEELRQGETMSLTVVGFTEEMLAMEGNGRFGRGSSVKSKEFYRNPPKSCYTKEIPDIKGTKHGGPPIRREQISFPSKFFDGNDVIYVFAKFADKTQGEVLDVAPIAFYPGSMSGGMRVHIMATTIERE